jgi:hypothetical protein
VKCFFRWSSNSLSCSLADSIVAFHSVTHWMNRSRPNLRSSECTRAAMSLSHGKQFSRVSSTSMVSDPSRCVSSPTNVEQIRADTPLRFSCYRSGRSRNSRICYLLLVIMLRSRIHPLV